jgi:hypothetical protein
MKVYEILDLKRQIETLENEVNSTTGEFIDNSEKIKDLINSLSVEKEEKLKAINHIIKQKQELISINKEEIKAIQVFNAQTEKEIISLNDLMGVLMQDDKESIKTNVGSFYFGKESVYIANESNFKQDNPTFVKEIPAISKVIDKEKVLQNIDTVVGARIRKAVIFRAKTTK